MSLFKAVSAVFMLTSLGLLASQAKASVTPITVNNFSFESPSTSTFVVGCPTSWSCVIPSTGTAGVYKPTTAQYTPVADGIAGIVPDGSQAAFMQSDGSITSISQTTSATITANTSYSLSVFTGFRQDFGRFADDAAIELLANGVVIATSGPLNPANGHWIDAILTYTAGAGNPNLGKTLGIALVETDSTGAQVNYDDVVLNSSPTPETNTILLFGTGLLVIGGLMRRKRAA